MKKKILAGLLASVSLAYVSTASAVITTTLHEDFASGAQFNGVLTFSNTYNALLDVNGVLSGGSYGTQNITWTWCIGTGQDYTDRNYDSNPATYEDWLMGGPEGVLTATPYI